jgi:hypothetical protein
LNVLPGSTIVGESGKALVVDRVDGDIIISGDRRIKLSAVVRVVPPLPPPTEIIEIEPPEIHIGDRLRRKQLRQTHYPPKWHLRGIDERPRSIPSIEAVVTKFSPDGYWVEAAGDLYHVPESAIEAGDWELVSEYQQN